jgi:hypothetical protein
VKAGAILFLKEGAMNMDREDEYVAAELSHQLVSELKLFEEKLSEESQKKLVVIAYEKEENNV